MWQRKRFCSLGDLGSDQLAGAAPRREPVDDDDGVLGDGLLEAIDAGRHCQYRGHPGRQLIAAAGRAARAWQSAAACFCLLGGPGRGNAETTHVSMLWTVIVGGVEWNDLAKVIRADVDRGVLETDVRVAMLRSGRRNCFAAGICIAAGRDGGCGGCRERLPVAPFLYLQCE